MLPCFGSRLRFALAAASLAASLAVPALADCPDAVVFVQAYVPRTPYPVPGVAWSGTIVDTWTTQLAFDRSARTLSLASGSSGRASAHLYVTDRVLLGGVADGTPVPCTIELQLDGTVEQNCGGSGCGVTLAGTIVCGADSVSEDHGLQGPTPGTPHPFTTTLALPVVLVAGVPADVTFHLAYGTGPGQTSATASEYGQYRVGGLPDGVTLTTCAGTPVTPASRPSWGGLKSRYR